MTAKDQSYEGWETDSHLQTFNAWNRQSNPHFNYVYGCFSEQRYLRSTVLSMAGPRVLDVGCATGTTYRYLRNVAGGRNFSYLGVDLSQPAIDRAKTLYPGADFRKKRHEKLIDFTGETYDVVYSRDTVLHQTQPYEFLRELLDVTGRYLILRLRTRDQGETVFDVELSCQMHYDRYWMPYILLNTAELIAFLKSYPAVSKIVINRSYEVLGGQNYRYLPKETYFTAAGGAETSLLIELSRDREGGEAVVEYDDTLQGHAYLKQHRARRYAYALASLVGRRFGL